jgi:hypothetical protein
MRRSLPVLLLLTASAAFPQSLEAVFSIGEKASCSVADFSEMVPAFAEDFSGDDELPGRLTEAASRYAPERTLTKGRASLMAARALRLKSSLMFMLLPLERYAFQALAVDGIFSASSSAGDPMSGVDLLDFVSAVGRTYGAAE